MERHYYPDTIAIGYGYARISSTTQSLETQVAQLTAYGCETIFQGKLSGRSLKHRAQFAAFYAP